MAAKKDMVASVLKLADKTSGRDRICRFNTKLNRPVGLIVLVCFDADPTILIH